MRNLSLLTLSVWCCTLLMPYYSKAQGKRLPNDPLAPFFYSKPTGVKILDAMTDSIELKRFTFSSRKGANTIYGTLASPKIEGYYPALLMLHGGGSCADEVIRLQRLFASKGYIVMAVDLPGICNPEKAKHSTGAWRNRPKGIDSRLDIVKGLDSSTLVDAIAAGLEGFNLLLAENNVDKTRTGITGFSWGGYMTTMLSGLLGKRVHAAYSVFGCGFYDRGSLWTDQLNAMPAKRRERWLTYFDAGRRAPNIACPYFIEATVNDKFFWPEAVAATLDTIKSEKNLLWNPNLDHVRPKGGDNMQLLYFNYHLKKVGKPFGKAVISKVKTEADQGKTLQISISMPANVTADSVKLYYGPKNAERHTRPWTAIATTKTSDKNYSVTIPAAVLATGIDYFIYVKDSRQVSVSTQIFKN